MARPAAVKPQANGNGKYRSSAVVRRSDDFTSDGVEDNEDEELFGKLRSVVPGRDIEGICGEESVAAELLPLEETFEGRRARPGRSVEGICDEGVDGRGRFTGVDDRSVPAVAVYACDSVESGLLGGEGPRRGREAGRGAGAIAGTNGLEENCDA